MQVMQRKLNALLKFHGYSYKCCQANKKTPNKWQKTTSKCLPERNKKFAETSRSC